MDKVLRNEDVELLLVDVNSQVTWNTKLVTFICMSRKGPVDCYGMLDLVEDLSKDVYV